MRGQGLYLGNERLLSVPLFAVQPDGSSNQVSCSISSDRAGSTRPISRYAIAIALVTGAGAPMIASPSQS